MGGGGGIYKVCVFCVEGYLYVKEVLVKGSSCGGLMSV